MGVQFLFAVIFAVQLGYWMLLWHGFRQACRGVAPEAATSLPPMSVIVAARNEAENLPSLLQALTRQTHPCFEIIVVDDGSTDTTAEVVGVWQQGHSNLRLLRIDEPQVPRKKHALTQGIAAATYDLLAFTDADCAPPPGWLLHVAQAHAAQPEDTLLIGYSPFHRATGFLNRWARYETFLTGFLTAAAVGLHRPYMAVGRNLSYPRRVFRRIGGFAHSLPSMSGDDDLLVQEVVRQHAAAIQHLGDPATFVPSAAPLTWKDWLRQKRRHLSAGRFYTRSLQAHLAVFQGTGILLWAAPFAAGWLGVGLLGLKLLVQGAVLREAAHAFRERDLLPLQPLFDLLYAAYNLLLAPLALARLPKKW